MSGRGAGLSGLWLGVVVAVHAMIYGMWFEMFCYAETNVSYLYLHSDIQFSPTIGNGSLIQW